MTLTTKLATAAALAILAAVSPGARLMPIAETTDAPAVVYLGDSYTDPNGAPTWADLLTADKAWTATNLAYGGTGYLLTNTPPPAWGKCALGQVCPSFADLVTTTAALDPDMVFVLGGRNELGSETDPAWQQGVAAFYAALHAAAPQTRIYALSPLWDDDPAPAGIATMQGIVRNAITTLPGACYLDLQNPLQGHPEYMAADGFHPNPAGQAAIADAVAAGMLRPTVCGSVAGVVAPPRTRP